MTRTPAYQVYSTEGAVCDTYTGTAARDAASNTFERLKKQDVTVHWTQGHVDSVTQEYTETRVIAHHRSSKPYKCIECKKALSFTDTFFHGTISYCGEHLPRYDKEAEGW